MKLLIVESPGKIKKLQSILPPEWRVAASVGHIRDLPQSGYGIEPPDFLPVYEISADKKEVVAKLRALVKQADEVYLASDPDREGESIAWHLKEVLGLSSPKRVTFTAITAEDVLAGTAAPRSIDMDLVQAQLARRSLDRLVGFKVSGPLSRATSEKGMSAGRVQSPAVRMVVEREQEIQAFVSTTHYGVELTFAQEEGIADWKAVWLPKEGWLQDDEQYVLDKDLAVRIAAARQLSVLSFEEKESTLSPPAPFTTSTLQQAAGNALKFSPKKTMELAQKLYEAGSITYMRTDSPNFSDTAIAEIRAYADGQGLPLPSKPRTWKSREGAQEAHEAIRPVHIDVEDAGETADEKALYKLIRLRALASQLADAVYAVRVARFEADVDGKKAVFEARGRTLVSSGWKQVMATDAAEEQDIEPDNAIPALNEGSITARSGNVTTKKTKPKPRFKQATLIREMEKRGIGRPATYAAILDNIIVQKGYLREDKGYLVPTARGEKLIAALLPDFSFMDLDFTKDLEDELDAVAMGKVSYADCLRPAHDRLMQELASFKSQRFVPCPECGNRDSFYHNVDTNKGWNYWKCKACNASFTDDAGRPGAKQEKKEVQLSEFACKTCGKPLAIRPTKKGGIYFACSGYPHCQQRYWATKDQKPDYDNPPR